ncbi:MAG: GntR family transcriptional regulator [Bacillota bacterium]|jgi:GntR family transcriptional regulator|nr:GntR family transcriptional regulator [Bacillota bacterium]HHT90083.1 GntR family transcriptional regulator [Bacillota bacterium]
MSSPAKLPHYLAIKNELEKRILSGQLGAGQKFPSEEELSKEFSVSSSTVKRAIGVLVSDGLVERTPGRGTFVSIRQSQSPLRNFAEEMRSRGLSPGSRLLDKKVITVHGELAWNLDVPEGRSAYYIYRLRTANDTPVALNATYIPTDSFPGLLDLNLEHMDLQRLLEERYKLSVVRAEEFITARLATESESKLLGGDQRPMVLLAVERMIEGMGQQRVMYDSTLYRADRYILHFDSLRYNEER